tara:strand:- start:953 stop:1063 length:111 start_codon:yes stop_codon:yes gene_type:complete
MAGTPKNEIGKFSKRNRMEKENPTPDVLGAGNATYW